MTKKIEIRQRYDEYFNQATQKTLQKINNIAESKEKDSIQKMPHLRYNEPN